MNANQCIVRKYEKTLLQCHVIPVSSMTRSIHHFHTYAQFRNRVDQQRRFNKLSNYGKMARQINHIK